MLLDHKIKHKLFLKSFFTIIAIMNVSFWKLCGCTNIGRKRIGWKLLTSGPMQRTWSRHAWLLGQLFLMLGPNRVRARVQVHRQRPWPFQYKTCRQHPFSSPDCFASFEFHPPIDYRKDWEHVPQDPLKFTTTTTLKFLWIFRSSLLIYINHIISVCTISLHVTRSIPSSNCL